MRKFRFFAALLGLVCPLARAETYNLTLKQALDRALSQNPDLVIARLDERKASLGVDVARAPFTPRIGVGTGLAYSNGFPLSIEGSAPAAFQAKVDQSLFNRPQTFAVAQAKEAARGAAIATGERRDEVVFRTAALYIDVDRAGRLADFAQKQADSLAQALEAINIRVKLGAELEVVHEEANVNFLRAQQRVRSLQFDREYGEHTLAVALGYTAADSVVPSTVERPLPQMPQTEEAALQAALEGNKELKRLQSNMQANALEARGYKAQQMPRVDLVAQYALLTRYSHYDEYFQKFKRNNGQIGASIQIPIFVGSAVKAEISQSEASAQRIRTEIEAARNRIMLDVHLSFQEIEKANIAAQITKAEVDLAHSRVSILLAQMNEGRASIRQVEEARAAEEEKWIAFYDAQFVSEKARFNVLKQTGQLMAALQ